jgi:hypothetical protein
MAASIESILLKPSRNKSDKPFKLHHGGEVNGYLNSIELSEDDYVIAEIEGYKVVLPEEMQARLEPYLNKPIGLANFFDKLVIRELDA